MENIREIFKLPNTEENIQKRSSIIEQYKEFHGIESEIGINICDVINWAKTNSE